MRDSLEDTIIAIATPPGRSALCLLRLSGPQALQILSESTRCDAGSFPSRSNRLCAFQDKEGRQLDSVLAAVYRAPHSYTGEEVVEISCHGSPVIARLIVEACVGRGARLARPGEFSLRAFLHGKMDLAQAEAVRDLIESQTVYQAAVARRQMEGGLSRALEGVKQELVEVLSHLETALEFVEDEVTPSGRKALAEQLERVDRQLEGLERDFRFGRIVHDGLKVVICGPPNVGKSSIFNKLSRTDGAIVTAVPGTTRDALRERFDLGGIPVELVDTAGIREGNDMVEQLGVSRSLSQVGAADLVLWVLDESRSFSEEDRGIWEVVRDRKCILVRNKQDLEGRLVLPRGLERGCAAVVRISALTGSGMDQLSEAIVQVGCPEVGGERELPSVTNLRHKECIALARTHLEEGRLACRSGASEEFVSYDLRKCLSAVGEVTGETTTEEILGAIFSTFCIGK